MRWATIHAFRSEDYKDVVYRKLSTSVEAALNYRRKPCGRWFVGDDLTGALHDLQLQLSQPLPASINRLTQVHLENGR